MHQPLTFHPTTDRASRPTRRLRAAVAVGLVALVGLGTPTAYAAPTDVGDDPQFDAGPPWAPDYGLLCSILERYGATSEHTCPTEPIGSTSGPR